MDNFWTSIANVLSGENGPLYVALCAIAALTLGWRFMDRNYQAEWEGGRICPAGSTPVYSNTGPSDNSTPSPEADDSADVPAE